MGRRAHPLRWGRRPDLPPQRPRRRCPVPAAGAAGLHPRRRAGRRDPRVRRPTDLDVGADFLIVYEAERPTVARAGLVYLVLTHIGTLALFMMFLAWRGPGADLTFRSLGLASPALPLGGAAILLLSLVGFGVKAGVV